MFDTTIYFWQRIVTPHMAYLADAIAAKGFDTVYVANQSMSEARAQMGWSSPKLERAKLLIAPDAESVLTVVCKAPANSIHVCQGLRSNGLVAYAQSALANLDMRQWVVTETVDDQGAIGALKRLVYQWIIWRKRSQLEVILAIGRETTDWLIARGANQDKVFPFAYFLPDSMKRTNRQRCVGRPFRFLFVGQLIELKRVDCLLRALAQMGEPDFELEIVGDGPLRGEWEAIATELLPGKVHWFGRIPMADIPQMMANADCLVLPSRHDGWGAVVSEALMVGTPVICSDACGAVGAVMSSGYGGLFPTNDVDKLTSLLKCVLSTGPLGAAERSSLKEWASSLGGEAGASFFIEILSYLEQRGDRPVAPWVRL
jgi:glycosyltransferase involved in cell wall biosynthesis